MVCSAAVGTKTGLSVFQLRFHYFLTSFFKAFGMHNSIETKEANAPVVSAFTPVSLLVYGDDHPSLKIFRCPPRTRGHLTHRRQPKNFSVKELGISGWISSQTAAFPAFNIWTTTKHSVVVMAFSFPKCTSFMSGVVIVTGFTRYLKYSPHLPRMTSLSRL